MVLPHGMINFAIFVARGVYSFSGTERLSIEIACLAVFGRFISFPLIHIPFNFFGFRKTN